MYTMKEACRETGMRYETLKFYCNEGLVPNVKRTPSNHRNFDERDIEWMKGLLCLKNCGMGVQEMKEYTLLCLKGESSIPERKAILERKRMQLLEQINLLQQSVAYIDGKQQFYDDVLDGKIIYFSNLISNDSE